MNDSQPLFLRTPGAFYNVWGLAFVLIFLFLFQIIFSFLSLMICSIGLNIPYTEVRQLLSTPDGTANAINVARLSNFITFTGYMLLPALLFSFINGTGPVKEAGWNRKLNLKTLGLALLATVLSISLVNWLTQAMQSIHWPQNLKYYADRLDSVRQDAMGTLLDMNTPLELLGCLALVALLPALFEELMFRGVLLNIFSKITGKFWTPIFLQAFVFAVLHFSFYELPGILLMGIIFGIITKTSGSTWYTVIMHFLFNGLSVVMHYLSLRYFEKTGVYGHFDDATMPGLFILFSILPLFYILLTLVRNNAKNTAA